MKANKNSSVLHRDGNALPLGGSWAVSLAAEESLCPSQPG